MKNEEVVDASVVLAVLNDENGGEIMARMENPLLSTVNAAEVQSVLVRSGMEKSRAWFAIQQVVSEILPFDAEQAELAGNLITKTKLHGLSLGDRACLALGLARGLPVYTADRAWSKIRAGVQVHIVR